MKTSPRASKTARLPVGEMAAVSISGATFSARGLSVIAVGDHLDRDLATFSGAQFSRYSLPPGLEHDVRRARAAGNVTSTSVNVVTCRAAPVVVSSAQMLPRWPAPRSDRK